MTEIEKKISRDRRLYYRIDTVFPVLIAVSEAAAPGRVLGHFQAFTRNISHDGLCLELNDAKGEFQRLLERAPRIQVEIEAPFQKEPIPAEIDVVWNVPANGGKRRLLGVHFRTLEEPLRKKLIRYARRQNLQPYFSGGVLLLILALAFVSYRTTHRIRDGLKTRTLALHETESRLNRIMKEKIRLEKRLVAENRRLYRLQNRIDDYDRRQAELEKRLETAAAAADLTQDDQWKEKLENARQKEQEARIKAGDYLAEKWKIEGELKRILREKKELVRELSEARNARKHMEEAYERMRESPRNTSCRVRLKNGMTVTGSILRRTGTVLHLKVEDGTLEIDRSSIQEVQNIASPSEQALRSAWKREGTAARELRDAAHVPGDEGAGNAPDRVEARGRRLFVDGKPFYVKGVGYGIEYPGLNGGMKDFDKIPFSVFEKDFRMIREAGFNTLRTYEPLNRELLDLAAENGLKVIENICYPSGLTDYSSMLHLSVLLDKALETVYRHKDHEALLMWSLWNDAPWVWAVGGSPLSRYSFETVNGFLKNLCDEIRKADPNHPVTASNVLGFEGSRLGFDFLDVLGFNTYIGGMDCYVQQDADSQLAKLTRIQKRHDKPVVILETGCSTFVERLDQGTVLKKQIETIGESLAGICIFQWADGWNKAGFPDRRDPHIEEHWGIVSGHREPKKGYAAISKIFGAVETESRGYTPPEASAS